MVADVSLSDNFIRGLACASLQPSLRTILVFDAGPTEMEQARSLWAQMLEVVYRPAKVLLQRVGTTETDDVLWGIPFPSPNSAVGYFVWRGLLREDSANHQLRVVVVPDLTRLSLPAQRAIVMAAGADVVHVERHGHSLRWQPHLCWLAGCASDAVGQISPHLLDRFALRLHAPGKPKMEDSSRIATLRRLVAGDREEQEVTASLPDGVAVALQKAQALQPNMTDDAARRVLAYLPIAGTTSVRRDLALARLAVANAALAGAKKVTVDHVDRSAAIMGFKPIEEVSAQKVDSQVPPAMSSEYGETSAPPYLGATWSSEAPSFAQTPATGTRTVYGEDTREELPASALPETSLSPYVEDHAPVQREAESLRLPLVSRGKAVHARGPAIGVQPALDLNDLSLSGTLFEAAKYQVMRRTSFEARKTALDYALIILPSDLRSYRRVPIPEMMLVLVVDYTCLRDCQWIDALAPHLQWAYTERASVGLVRVGAADSTNELKAERLLVRSLLVPRFEAALAAKPGRATPLAHGLDLALQTLRHALHHGRSAVLRARLVVLTDGRGNVPLQASRTDVIRLPVNREGIEDAMRVALQLGTLERVEKVFLNPQPVQHSELPEELALALGAPICEIHLEDELV